MRGEINAKVQYKWQPEECQIRRLEAEFCRFAVMYQARLNLRFIE